MRSRVPKGLTGVRAPMVNQAIPSARYRPPFGGRQPIYLHIYTFLLKGGMSHEDDYILYSCAESIDVTLRSSEVHLVLTFFAGELGGNIIPR